MTVLSCRSEGERVLKILEVCHAPVLTYAHSEIKISVPIKSVHSEDSFILVIKWTF
jgi:hypothetical protein